MGIDFWVNSRNVGARFFGFFRPEYTNQGGGAALLVKSGQSLDANTNSKVLLPGMPDRRISRKNGEHRNGFANSGILFPHPGTEGSSGQPDRCE
jgi:hypothetical protein